MMLLQYLQNADVRHASAAARAERETDLFPFAHNHYSVSSGQMPFSGIIANALPKRKAQMRGMRVFGAQKKIPKRVRDP